MTTDPQTLTITTIEILTQNGPIAVIAEATDTPGLFVTPDLDGGDFSGTFAITHGPSGLQIPMGWDGEHVDQVRAIARSLGTTPVDWTADRDTVQAQIAEHHALVVAARHDAKYPVLATEETSELGGYPKNEEQATADAIAKHLTVGLQHQTRETWNLVGRRDADGLRIHGLHSAAMVADWALVHVLREFAKVDKQAADAVAREVWEGWEDGSTIHEVSWDWAREYGLPELPEKDEPAAETPAVATLTTSEVL